MQALVLTYDAYPQSAVMSFMRDYGEPYDWLYHIFRDWFFTFLSCFFFYEDKDDLSLEGQRMYRMGMAAFGGNAPTYHIELRETPTLVWDFHSLMMDLKMLFSFMLTDESRPLRMCRRCHKVFIADRADIWFCSGVCEEDVN